MAETTKIPDTKQLHQNGGEVIEVPPAGVKAENVVKMERECRECVVCANRSEDYYDIYYTKTTCTQTVLYAFLCNFTHVDLADKMNFPKFMCKFCFELVNILEQAELEYIKLKENFESIINKNPLFEDIVKQSVDIQLVKNEKIDGDEMEMVGGDSDDEPLSTKSKRRHKPRKNKKKLSTDCKKKIQRKHKSDKQITSSAEDPYECGDCSEEYTTGAELTSHITVKHEAHKNEGDTDNVFGYPDQNTLKVEIEDSFPDDDHSRDFLSNEDLPNGDDPGLRREAILLLEQIDIKKLGKRKKKTIQKVMHKCDQCDAKYSSLSRLAYHKLKHDTSKPPYICEICGAHYKHKKACDIHIALHKGISDWKCEECDKLFPSKGALHRHNNIHTGKANYQCDLCGKSFIHTSSFKMHKLAHTGLKPHSCEQCGLALMTRSHLKRHERVHSGEKRHECSLCGKRFSERYNLVAHSRSHDAVRPGPALAAAVRRRLFRCAFCENRFERRFMLERHMEGVHQRSLERPPPKPRNTMSKLLKAQAAGGARGARGASVGPPPARPLVLVISTDRTDEGRDSESNEATGSVGATGVVGATGAVGATGGSVGATGGVGATGAGYPRTWSSAYEEYYPPA